MLAGFGGQTGLNLAMELDQQRHPEKVRHGTAGRKPGKHQKGGRPGRIQEADAGDRRADPEQRHRDVYGRMLRLRQGRRLSCDHSDRRIRWAAQAAVSQKTWNELEHALLQRHGEQRYRSDPAGKICSRLEGDRVRSDPRRPRQLHHHLQHGKPGPGRCTYR